MRKIYHVRNIYMFVKIAFIWIICKTICYTYVSLIVTEFFSALCCISCVLAHIGTISMYWRVGTLFLITFYFSNASCNPNRPRLVFQVHFTTHFLIVVISSLLIIFHLRNAPQKLCFIRDTEETRQSILKHCALFFRLLSPLDTEAPTIWTRKHWRRFHLFWVAILSLFDNVPNQ